MSVIIYYAGSILLIVAAFVYAYTRYHQKRHLFVLSCPLCRRDPMRLAMVADMYGFTEESEMLWNAASGTPTTNQTESDQTPSTDATAGGSTPSTSNDS